MLLLILTRNFIVTSLERVEQMVRGIWSIVNSVCIDFNFMLVNRIKQRTRTSITIPADSSSIRIEGSHKGVAEAKTELLEMAAKLENERKKDIKIEHRFHRQIIGAQGQHIRELRDRFQGVQISFPDPKSQIDMVTLRGPKEMVDKCATHMKKENDELVCNMLD